MEFPSKLLEDLVYNISQLSGIGKRSALRIALEILRKPKEYSRDLSESIYDFKTQIKFCSQCHNISDKDVCDICLNPSRDQSCVRNPTSDTSVMNSPRVNMQGCQDNLRGENVGGFIANFTGFPLDFNLCLFSKLV